ncbi:broad specificity phosphatase PhoE [Flavobacterium sp. CG_23.5]|uniref:histidine phosphatase family protein n=1 Tax=unclassified Flavobacterium TaxID=196869 RepID=UPI0018C9B5AA|nr:MULTISPECIES: phosphoglycerate mutase family protein [unclassified Flavobacterium]MBG6110097.1 broad specificity phosphatase PhoE [Flavobacterium sp. CG_9.10]MBP2281906.1 broad specificity phosphatase PhoE [Flavobacterium sp. CG_23.5]
MKKYLLIVAFFVLQVSFGQNTTTTYYFIRHAEKVDNSKNPDLSQTGLQRAKLWNEIFSEINLDAIYSTDFNRTLQTATPTATNKKISIIKYNPKTIDLESFKKETLGKKVLVVGHSNTIPNFVNQIIGQKIYFDINDTTFGNLYIVTINGDSINHQLLKLP